jgi:hypothetical protein
VSAWHAVGLGPTRPELRFGEPSVDANGALQEAGLGGWAMVRWAGKTRARHRVHNELREVKPESPFKTRSRSGKRQARRRVRVSRKLFRGKTATV